MQVVVVVSRKKRKKRRKRCALIAFFFLLLQMCRTSNSASTDFVVDGVFHSCVYLRITGDGYAPVLSLHHTSLTLCFKAPPPHHFSTLVTMQNSTCSTRRVNTCQDNDASDRIVCATLSLPYKCQHRVALPATYGFVNMLLHYMIYNSIWLSPSLPLLQLMCVPFIQPV